MLTQNLESIIILIVLIVSGIGAFIIGLIYYFVSHNRVEDRLDRYMGIDQDFPSKRSDIRSDQFSQIRSQVNTSLSLFSSQSMTLKLLSAGWPISDTEFYLIRLAVTALAFVIGWLISGSIVGGIILAVFVYFIPGILLTRGIYQRRKKFSSQLVDVLVLIRGAVRSGYSLLQSLEVVVNEMPSPAAEEFNRVLREVQLGLPLSEALMNLDRRMEDEDLHLVVAAININIQSGGNLTVMLNVVTNTIRDRAQLMSEVRSLTSYARYAGYLLSFLPLITAVIVFFVNPTYFTKSLQNVATQLIFIAAAIGVLIGNIWLRQIIKIEV